MRVPVIFLAATLSAASPVITELQPRGAQKGRPFKLTIAGRDIAAGARILTSLPATFTLLADDKSNNKPAMGEGRYATFLVEPSSELSVGVYPVRLETAEGLSNVLLFTVGAFPELTEEESLAGSLPNRNDSIENAQGIPSTPVIVNGTLGGPERDIYRVSGKAGERRIFEVQARRCGSAIDPVIRVLDSQAKQLARSEDAPLLNLDARLEVTFPREGYYYVEVHDARFSSQVQNFYRLQTGFYSYASEIFPLGGQRGRVVTVDVSGAQVQADLRKVSPNESQIFVNLPDSPALPLPFAIGDYPEITEPANDPLTLPVTVNARLSKPAEVDRYTLEVSPGDELLFELQARELGASKLAAVITVFDEAGKKLASAGDGPLPLDVFQVQGVTRTVGDPFLNLKVPAGVRKISVAVEDLAQRGGPGYAYRLTARKQPHDFHLTIATPYVNIPAGGSAAVTVAVDRRGYNGPIQLAVPSPPPGVTVEGGFIPEEILDGNNIRISSRRGVLVLTSGSGSASSFPATELTVVGQGGGLTRTARGIGMSIAVAGATAQGVVDRQRSLTAPWLAMQLPAAPASSPAATLAVELVERKRMTEGDQYLFRWTWKPRQPAQRMPDQVNPDLVNANDLRIIDMKPDPNNPNSGTFLITTTKNTYPGQYDLLLTGRLMSDGQTEEIVARPIRVTVEEVNSSAASPAPASR